jgi:SAM-dependent methyltransferase
MVYDPVHRGQLYLRRAGRLLRSQPAATARIDGLDEAARERFFDVGRIHIAKLGARIESHTGCPLESRRALDFGCGVGRMTLPLAERCEHVYGVDVSPAALSEANCNARRMNLSNVEWMEAGRLAELSGCYDLVISVYVFQHIPSREGERIFATLLRGLRPGGVGAINVTVPPNQPLAELFRWTCKLVRRPFKPFNLARDWDWSYPYMLMNSYSLNRVGRVLADAGVTEWHANWHLTPVTASQNCEAVTVIFRKK